MELYVFYHVLLVVFSSSLFKARKKISLQREIIMVLDKIINYEAMVD